LTFSIYFYEMFFKRASGEIHSAFEFHITLGWVFTDQLFFYWDQLFIIGISSLLLGSALYCWDLIWVVIKYFKPIWNKFI